MQIIKYLIFKILFQNTIVVSSKCRNSCVECIELCCEANKTYDNRLQWCLELPKYAKPIWYNLYNNMKKKEPVTCIEFADCSLTLQQSVIDKCYAPYYHIVEKEVKLLPHFKVPCHRNPTDIGIATAITILALSFILLPILLALTCTKRGKKNALSRKLINCYITSMIACRLTLLLKLYIDANIKSHDSPFIYLTIFPDFFFTSTFFWLSCIGYNAYVQFKIANVQNTERKDRKHFIWSSIFVWGCTSMVCIVDNMIEGNLPFDATNYLTAGLNVIFFLLITFKICLTRCRVIGISTQKHIKCKLALVICRLCILMGTHRMLFCVLIPVIGSSPFQIMLTLEPYLVYGTFISEYENYSSLFRCKCCCSKSHNEENDIPMEEITKTTIVQSKY